MESLACRCGLALAGRIRHYARLFMMVALILTTVFGGAFAAPADAARQRLELRDSRGALLWSKLPMETWRAIGSALDRLEQEG